MTTETVGGGEAAARGRPGALAQQAGWLAAGLLVGFLVPFVFADLLEAPRDLYYALYAVAVVAFLTAWVRVTGQPLGEMLRRRWVAAVVLGVACAGVMALVVLRVEDASPRADGAELVGAMAWRGVVYGAIDGLFLSSFPIIAVFAAAAGTRLRRRRGGTIAVGALALAASIAMTAAYHAGYAQFRSSDMRSPLAGDVVWSLPTLVTLNPIGAPIAHIGLHTSAVLHSDDTDLFLPPSSEARAPAGGRGRSG